MAELSRRQLSRAASGVLLGPLEFEIMAILWKHGASTVSEIAYLLPQKPAHTTVLSTCSRLIAKRLVRKSAKIKNAVIYAPTCNEREWQREAARQAVARLLSTPNIPREVLKEVFEIAWTRPE